MTISLRSYKLVIGLLLLLAFAGTLEVSVASSIIKPKIQYLMMAKVIMVAMMTIKRIHFAR